MEIRISDIRRDGGTQLRAGTNEDIIQAYAEAMRAGAVFPPVVVFVDGEGAHWLADGFQRIDAASRCGSENIECDVRAGSVRDAILYACGANSGLGRTDADKRRAVEKLLNDSEWSKWVDVKIAQCHVSRSLVQKIKANLPRVVSSIQVSETADQNDIMHRANVGP